MPFEHYHYLVAGGHFQRFEYARGVRTLCAEDAVEFAGVRGKHRACRDEVYHRRFHRHAVQSVGIEYEWLIGCEAAGRGVDTERTAATMATGTLGVFHGMKSYFCQNEYGQIAPVYSISAGLDYPGVGPEHANLKDTGRAEYVPITDDEAVDAFEYIARTEGIICAIESAHAVAHVMELAPKMNKDDVIICCLSGRGDKDVAAIARYRGKEIYE